MSCSRPRNDIQKRERQMVNFSSLHDEGGPVEVCHQLHSIELVIALRMVISSSILAFHIILSSFLLAWREPSQRSTIHNQLSKRRLGQQSRNEFVTNQKQSGRRRRSRQRGSVDCALVATSYRREYYNHDEYYLFQQSNAAAAHRTPTTTSIGRRRQISNAAAGRQSGRVCHSTRVTRCQ